MKKPLYELCYRFAIVYQLERQQLELNSCHY